jgi:hypothetical protein
MTLTDYLEIQQRLLDDAERMRLVEATSLARRRAQKEAKRRRRRQRALDEVQRPSGSVRTVSGGLPGLGKR